MERFARENKKFVSATDGDEIDIVYGGGVLTIIATGGATLTVQVQANSQTETPSFINLDTQTIPSGESRTIYPTIIGKYKIIGGDFTYGYSL